MSEVENDGRVSEVFSKFVAYGERLDISKQYPKLVFYSDGSGGVLLLDDGFVLEWHNLDEALSAFKDIAIDGPT